MMIDQLRFCKNIGCWKYWKINETDSTNDLVKVLSEDFSVIRADYQRIGRGQQGKIWSSPARKNILATFKFPKNYVNNCLAFAVAAAIIKTLNQFEIACYCKWPNDILTNDGKISGILIETDDQNYYIGIGLNVNWPEQQEFDGKNYRTSFFAEKNLVDIELVFDCLALNLENALKLNNSELLYFIRKVWNGKNQKVEVNYENKWCSGYLHDITEQGYINIKLADGSFVTISSSNQIKY